MLALAGLLPLWVALLLLILGGGRRGDPCGGPPGACAPPQAAGGAVSVEGGQEALAPVVGFEPAAEFQERGGRGHARGSPIQAGQPLPRRTVVERGFERFVGPALPWLEKRHPQPPLPSDGRASAFAFGLERFEDGQPFRPRKESFQAGQKFLAAGDLLRSGKLGWGKTRWVGQALKFRKPRPVRLLQISKTKN